MAFININKVEIKDSDDAITIMSGVVLLFASLTYDDIKGDKHKEALQQLESLKYSIAQLEYVIKNKTQ